MKPGEGLRIEDLEGMHVLCADGGLVLTVYRNRILRLRDTPFQPTET